MTSADYAMLVSLVLILITLAKAGGEGGLFAGNDKVRDVADP